MPFYQHHGLNLHYNWIDSKKNRTFLFINSLGTDYHIWDQVVLRFQEYGNILLMDNRGHGLSDTSPIPEGLDGYVRDVVSLLQYLQITKCSIIGLSVGGMIAQCIAHDHPEYVEKLVLCDTHSKIGNESIWNTRIQQVESNGLSSISAGVMHRWFSASYMQQFPEQVKLYQGMMERCSPTGYIQTCIAIRDADLTAQTKNIKIPTLCVVGAEDLSTTPDEVKALSSSIKNSEFVMLQGSAHIPCVDNADLLSSTILDFINQ